ncbi:MAG: 4Fe-4S dicluster domain-containing protein [Eggerthellaceae bacterium]|nr:4Fe-4S dicluster domain-containing protein [Eggerthellaceae bacterium]
MTKYAFAFDAARCTGCKTCNLACKDYHDLSPQVTFRKIYEYAGGSFVRDAKGTLVQNVWTNYISMNCNHCDKPACVEVCPTGAMHRDDQGFISVDHDRCVGCKYCEMACPYNVPSYDADLGQMRKCDGCSERVAAGETPICVDACPLYALDFGTEEDMRKKHGDGVWLAPLPSPDYTEPTTIMSAAKNSRAGGTHEGVLANPKEVM